MRKYKRYLAAVWFSGAGIVFLLLILQTQLGHFTGKDRDVWAWFLPTVMPTLSLIIGVLVMDAFGKGMTTAKPDRFLFKVAVGLSWLYLGVVLLTILLQPFAQISALEMMQNSHIYLGPLQGLVAGSLSAFFVSK